jgi:uncharacterized protein YihD (DUF1040 family)
VVNKNLKPIVQILSPKTKKANNLIMLDRDGTINRDSGYTHKLSDLFILSKNLEIINEFVNDFINRINKGIIDFFFFAIGIKISFYGL